MRRWAEANCGNRGVIAGLVMALVGLAILIYSFQITGTQPVLSSVGSVFWFTGLFVAVRFSTPSRA